MTTGSQLHISTPGRICLFGEHQDYLGLPVVPCAISLRIDITARLQDERRVVLELPDVGAREEFGLDGVLSYGAERDYLRSSVNVMKRHGFSFSRGIEGTVRGRIPINSGTSSSSALIVTWINLLARMSDEPRALPPGDLARLAHEAEVVEFGEPGGMMDHYATAFGGALAIDFFPEIHVEKLRARFGTFVLGDSGEPKDTRGILARVKQVIVNVVARLRDVDSTFNLQSAGKEEIERLSGSLTRAEEDLLHGTLRNRDLTRNARHMLQSGNYDDRALGRLLTEHQTVLRDILKISTPKIDRMLDAAMAAGAYGGKINGSGGGGCMFCYAPERPEKVADAIQRTGGKAYIVSVDEGTRVEEGGKRS